MDERLAPIPLREDLDQLAVRLFLYAIHVHGDKPVVELREARKYLRSVAHARIGVAIRHDKRNERTRRVARQRQHGPYHGKHVRPSMGGKVREPSVRRRKRGGIALAPFLEGVREAVPERDEVESVSRIQAGAQYGLRHLAAVPEPILADRARSIHQYHRVLRHYRQRVRPPLRLERYLEIAPFRVWRIDIRHHSAADHAFRRQGFLFREKLPHGSLFLLNEGFVDLFQHLVLELELYGWSLLRRLDAGHCAISHLDLRQRKHRSRGGHPGNGYYGLRTSRRRR